MILFSFLPDIILNIRGCHQKFPDWVDQEVKDNKNKHSLEATQSVMAAKTNRMTHKIVIQLYLVDDSSTIRSRRPIRKILDTPS
jgi:hypothetical protein